MGWIWALQLTNSVIDIATGDYHTVYIGSDYSLNFFGDNTGGQLVIGPSFTQLRIPTILNGSFVTNSSQIPLKLWAETSSTFFWMTNSLYVTGDNTRGTLGLKISQIYYTPVPHPFTRFNTEGIMKISSGKGGGLLTKEMCLPFEQIVLDNLVLEI